MMEEDEREMPEYASPPCFMHELAPEYRLANRQADRVQWNDVVRFRKAERARLLAERLDLSPGARHAAALRIADRLVAAIADPRAQIIGAYWP
ncbi:MAG: 5-formyltetrahydrofolate cyclo-ligase, partial [Phyllobacterium sp.]